MDEEIRISYKTRFRGTNDTWYVENCELLARLEKVLARLKIKATVEHNIY